MSSGTARILHVADSFAGVDPYGSAERAREVWNGLGHAVRCAVSQRADVLLHSGTVLSEFAGGAAVHDEARRMLGEAEAAGVRVVVNGAGQDLTPLDLDVVDAHTSIEAGGVTFSDVATLGDVRARCNVVVARVMVDGVPRLDRGAPYLDARELVGLDAAYIALGGSSVVQPVQPNAWYAGQTARVDVRDRARAGGLLVDLSLAEGRVQRLGRITWPDRPHRLVRVCATGLSAAELDVILMARVSAEVAHRSDGDLPGVDPVLEVVVSGASADPVPGPWLELLEKCCAYAQISWNGKRGAANGRLLQGAVSLPGAR